MPRKNKNTNNNSTQEIANSKKADIAEQLKNQRTAAGNKVLFWLDEDDDVEREADVNSVAREVEDPMADLRAAWNRGEPAKIQGDRGPSKEEQQELLDKAQNLIAQTEGAITEEEKEALSKINERILSSLPEDKVLTEAEIQEIDRQVAQALQDEKEEQKKAANKTNPDPRSITLPNVNINEYKPQGRIAKQEDPKKDEPVQSEQNNPGKRFLYGFDDVAEEEKDSQTLGENINDSSRLDTLQIPDFYDRWEKRMKNDEVTKQVKSELSDIFKSAGITEPSKTSKLVENSYSNVTDSIKNIYLPNAVTRAKMSFDAPLFFNGAYLSLVDTGLSTVDEIITAQKIADLMLKNYSPVAFANNMLDRYADKYVISNRDLLKEHLEELHFASDEIDQVIQEVQDVLAGVPKKEQTTEEKNPNTTNELTAEQMKHLFGNNLDVDKQLEGKEKGANGQAEMDKQKETKPEVKTETKPETKPIISEARVAVYEEKLKAYNNMYKLDIDSNHFASFVTEAWELMTSGDKQKMADGQKVMNNLFKDTLKKAFDVEKDVAYNEHRLPEYAEIIKSTNELMRSAMYGFTDMYHNAKRSELFETTAFGGLNDKDMADLTVGQSLWSMDQKSDEAWDIQSKEAKNIAEKWMKEDKPHEKMIAEMKALVESNEKGIVSRKEMVDKLTAAEWLLENDEKMMIKDDNDPYNPIPNWGNRYWKTLTETREALGIDKHTSMRDMIQADYAASAKAVNNRNYNLMQINYYVLDKDVRELADSRDVQMEQFAIQGAAVKLTKPQENKELEDGMTATRQRHPVEQLNERNIMKNEPKNDKWILEEVAHQELTILNQANAK